MNITKDLNKKIISIQSLYRGNYVRKQLSSLNDNMNYNLIVKEINNYNNCVLHINEINKILSKKKIRHNNFPSHISENIAKFAIFNKYKIMPCWDTDKGDIVINKLSLFKQIEIKGFMSDGPSSFGPSEKWDLLYFVDARDTLNFNFKVYEIKLSNKNEIFRNIKINKNETYGEIADNNQRGKLRGCFETVFKYQLGDKCKLIFNGHISNLNNIN
jgi:hypothetical protein